MLPFLGLSRCPLPDNGSGGKFILRNGRVDSFYVPFVLRSRPWIFQAPWICLLTTSLLCSLLLPASKYRSDFYVGSKLIHTSVL